MQLISGGVTAARGFLAGGLHAGLKREKKDLALIVSESPAKAAAAYTKNVVKAAPLLLSKKHLADGSITALIANSGNANACAPEGEENALRMCSITAQALGIPVEQVAVASTGVIGVSMTEKMPQVEAGILTLASQVSSLPSASAKAAEAIMTTDLSRKEIAFQVNIGGESVHIGGIAKGSGMIHPNMATMLAFLTTDVSIDGKLLDEALRHAIDKSFHRITVDGDTSTNDFCLLMANGLAENPEICEKNADYEIFLQALTAVCVYLAREIAADGEGARHLITCTVERAPDENTAAALSRSVISSSLVKTAVFGRDANWGRILCAMGYAGVDFDPARVTVSFQSEAGEITVCENGRGLAFDEVLAEQVLTPRELTIRIDMAQGTESATCWGCDLSYDYVKINGEYRT